MVDLWHISPMEPTPFGKVKLIVEYDGTHYKGWQRQADGLPTIQASLEGVLEQMFHTKINVIGAGRTDAGVHALNQVCHFVAPRKPEGINFVAAFSSHLNPDIAIKQAESVGDDFHAQRTSIGKTYLYRILNRPYPRALESGRSLWIRKPLDTEKLNRGAQHLVGTHDFNAFRSEGSFTKTTIRTVYKAEFTRDGDFVDFRITGSGFLKQMVRNIVGTLLHTEIGTTTTDDIPTILASKDRTKAGPTAPPQGLYLEKVYYPGELDLSAFDKMLS